MGSCVSVASEGTTLGLIMILRLALIFCLGTTNLVQGAISDVSESEKKGFTDSMNDFTQDFLAVAWEDLGENFVFSPFSLHSVLAMLTSGATNSSKTQKELLAGFGRNSKIDLLERLYGQFVKDYKTPEIEKTLKFGNRMWTTQKYYPKVLQPYRNTISKLYDAEFSKLPAKNGEVEVNNWVSDITKGKITNIIDQVSPDTAFLIVNALYFKASWAKSFEEGKSQEFTKFDGKKIIVPMMTRESKKQAAGRFTTELVKGRSDKCISVAIPYEAAEGLGNEGRFEMLIIMPEHHQGLQVWQFNAEKSVDEVSTHGNIIEMALASLEDSRENRDDHIINIPEFKIDSNIGAVPMLEKLGVEAAFNSGEFQGIVTDEPLKVSKIKHRAAIEVTKEGTLGVAASAIELVALSASLSAPKTIDLNKPFLFFVRDKELNAILFAGKYTTPDGNTGSQ